MQGNRLLLSPRETFSQPLRTDAIRRGVGDLLVVVHLKEDVSPFLASGHSLAQPRPKRSELLPCETFFSAVL